MKKIMFNDRYGLTEAVLSGRKTQTRRIITCPKMFKGQDVRGFNVHIRQSDGAILEYPNMYDADEREIEDAYILPKYKVGEVVAVAQSYADAGVHFIPEEDEEFGCYNFPAEQTHGWTNKLYVRSSLMPHRIRITNVRVERLNDISEADCLAEGIEKVKECENLYRIPIFHKSGSIAYLHGSSPRAVYVALIDRISGKETWQSNPYVFVYDFELVK